MKLLLMILLLAVTSAQAEPVRVVLIRHAEKPIDENNTHLSAIGLKRADFLRDWFVSTPALTNGGFPVALFAPKPTKDRPSERSKETLKPLADRLSLPVQTPHSAKNYAKLARSITGESNFRGKTVVVCWAHDFLPEFAAALGVKEKLKWRSSDYDTAWLITITNGHAVMESLRQNFQM